ncbi:peroxiredoxin [Parvularcula sp. ZS-1/3]|uniref:Glutathione-dependent peroxiredoxin n=1 Tax=Parvularcula mediterranea TaxID=2732508 RepID=A0A7Y3RN22_9PROT|nr:peroxiredoxin [Parvularcula mediterranea]NNU16601.1 peroxiredoxin [Parvularcula mediterranea]
MISKGDKLPSIQVFEATGEGPKPVTTEELFSGKKTVLFAVPGAFTPTCSAKHLPGFVEKQDALKAKGVDQIVCMSVNDAFVMKAWGDSANADGITMLADGNAALTEALGLEMDGTGFGMGKRSQRFAMVLDGTEVSEVFVEDPGAFEVSSAEHVLANL